MGRTLLALSLLAAACGGAPSSTSGGGDGSPGGGDVSTSGGGAGATGGGSSSSGGGSAGGQGGGSGVHRIVSLSCGPATLQVAPGAQTGLNAFATFDDGTSTDVSGSVTWSSSATTIVRVVVISAADNDVVVQGLTDGTATVTAATGSITSSPCTVTVKAGTVVVPPDAGTPPAQEARAVWVTRFAYNTEADVKAILTHAQQGGFNLVYFQVRGNGDAYYRSSLAPWAKKLTGTLGQDPGWDPLQVAITEAHVRGMQLHAYWNVFAGWPVPTGCATAGTCTCDPIAGKTDSCALPEASAAGAPDHYLRTHPTAMAVNAAGKSIDTEYYWLSPGDPAVRAHILAAATEVMQKYEIDGLHLDRIRYPGQVYSYDPASNAAFAALPAPKPTREDWQRGNVTTMVGDIYAALKQYRPKAMLSASVWGIYKPLPGCSTSQGFGNYFQDSQGWIQAGKIDALNPMIYWDLGTGCTDWAKLLDGFLSAAGGRWIITGMHALDQGKPHPERMAARIAYARAHGAAGTTIFASTYLELPPADGGFTSTWPTFRQPGGPYATDAGVPVMPWK